MPDLTTETRRVDGVTYVECRLHASEPHRIVLENRLDGPVLPPRSRGVPERGWDETGFEGRIDAGVTGLGYAVRAPAEGEPVELVSAEPAPEEDRGIERTPEGVVRALGDPRPPRDAVPVGESANDEGEESAVSTPETEQSTVSVDDAPTTLPAEMEAWLRAIEDRAARIDRLAAVETLPEATEVVGDMGGLDEVEAVTERAERDREQVAALRGRLATLEADLDREVPLETLRRLA